MRLMGHKTSNNNHHHFIWIMLTLLLLPQEAQSWSWFFSSSSTETPPPHSTVNPSEMKAIAGEAFAEFSLEPLDAQKGMKLIENARSKMIGSNSCWQKAYQNLFAACSEVLAGEEKRSRLAWHLSDCFQEMSGRPRLLHCDAKAPMVKCLKGLDEDTRRYYLEFFLQTNSICHQLQIEAFKRQTERLVNDLKRSAEYAEDKLENIEATAQHLLQNSNQIQNTLASIDHQTQKVAKTSKNVEDHVHAVLKHSEAVHEQSKEIAASQSELRQDQEKMKEKLEEGMTMLHESYDNLGQEINNIKNEAIEIEKEIGRVGNTVSSKMESLQSKADDIGNMTGISLDKQKQLLDGQSAAIEGLQFLTKFQSQALEESRDSLQMFAEFGQKHQEELLQKQEQLQQAHDQLFEHSKTILATQEAFESKQASMFIVIDKLFALHNAMLLESRLIKTFIVYSLSIFILYIFTSTKQTYPMRPRLYVGLCVAFLVEFVILQYATYDIEQVAWMISLTRSLFVLLSAIQLLYAIFTYRDYEVLNHKMLLTLLEKVNHMQQNKELEWDTDSKLNWSSWVDTELPEDVDKLEDPDYMIAEEVGENSIAISPKPRKYNLRNRVHC